MLPFGYVDVRIDAVNLMLNNDVFGQNIPIAEARLSSIVGVAQSTSEAVRCSMEITFDTVYHNLRLMAWEPAIEPWRCRMEVYLPKVSWRETKNGYNIDTRADTEYGGSTSNTGGGRTAVSSDSDFKGSNRLPVPDLQPRTSSLSGFSDVSERDINYYSENPGAWQSATTTHVSRNSQAQSSSSEALLGGLGEWAGDKVGSGANSSADLVKHRPSIAITSMSTLNINVTEAVVENFMEVSKGWKLVADQMQALKKQINDRRQSLLRKTSTEFVRTPVESTKSSASVSTTPGSLEREQISLYRIRNETGTSSKVLGLKWKREKYAIAT